MNRPISALLFLFIFIFHIQADAVAANLQKKEIVSPEIHEDNSVTFRLFAPEAKNVTVTGDFLNNGTKVQMKKDTQGIWSYTTTPLPSEIYTYLFLVDGLQVSDPNNVYNQRNVDGISNILLIRNGKADVYATNDVPHGTIAKRWYHSPENNMSRRITIYTPPGYEENKKKAYPVLYLLHGMGGDEEAWMILGRASQILDNLIAQGKAEPMIMVVPNGNVVQDAAPGESNQGYYKPQSRLPHTMDGKYEESFHEIIRFVDSQYRTISKKKGRAIAGLSMGGYHTLHISRYYPNTFDYIGLFSAAIMPNENVKSKVYDNIDQTLITQKKNGYKLYWIAIGKDDFLINANTNYRKRLDDLQLPYVYWETEGGHSWRNWRIYLTEFLPMLFK